MKSLFLKLYLLLLITNRFLILLGHRSFLTLNINTAMSCNRLLRKVFKLAL